MTDEAADRTEAGGSDDGPERLAALRAAPTRRRVATALAVVVGMALAWVDAVGIVAGAALVALPRRTPASGVVAGVAFGALVVVADLVVLAGSGSAAVEARVAMTQPFLLGAGIALAGGVVGGLVRGVV